MNDEEKERRKKELKEKAREHRREAYKRAKAYKKKREAEMQRLVEEGLVDPESLETKPKSKIPSRSFAEQDERPKKAKEPETSDEDLWEQIHKASELEKLRELAREGKHLSLIK